MKAEIEKIQYYFKERILNGEFKITKRSIHTYNILVDGEYPFIIWVANNYDNRNFYHYSEGYFMKLNLKTLKERHKLHSVLNKDYKNYIKTEHKKELINQINLLKKQLP